MAKKNPFSSDYAPYGRYEGERGSDADWKSAFANRMGAEEAGRVLSGVVGMGSNAESSARGLLGIGFEDILTESVIKKNFRQKARITHADHGGSDESFKQVHAAYSLLMSMI